MANWSAPGIVGANYASSGLHLELAKRNLKVGVLSPDWVIMRQTRRQLAIL